MRNEVFSRLICVGNSSKIGAGHFIPTPDFSFIQYAKMHLVIPDCENVRQEIGGFAPFLSYLLCIWLE